MVIQQRPYFLKQGFFIHIQNSLCLRPTTDSVSLKNYFAVLLVYNFIHSVISFLYHCIDDFSFSWILKFTTSSLIFFPVLVCLTFLSSLFIFCFIGVSIRLKTVMYYFTISQVYSPIYTSLASFVNQGNFLIGFLIFIPMMIANYLMLANLKEKVKSRKLEDFAAYLVVFVGNVMFVVGNLCYFWCIVCWLTCK